MFDRVNAVVNEMRSLTAELEPGELSANAAVNLLEKFSTVEKLASAAKALCSKRVAETGEWKKGSDRSPAHFIARTTGESVGGVVQALETAKRVDAMPAVEEALREGKVSIAQANVIASAAASVPGSETGLLEVAQTENLVGLRQAATKVAARAADQADRAERLHRSRYLRTWTEADGAFRLEGRLTPECGAEFRSVLDAFREEEFQAARRQGRRESYEALDADALVAMSRSARGGSTANGRVAHRAVMNIRVDRDALLRGAVQEGEVCEASGVGPIPVAAARSLLSDAFVRFVFTKGTEIDRVCHIGRTIPARLDTALRERYPECAVIGCHETRNLERDHVVPVEEGGVTAMDNLTRFCRPHHKKKTFGGYRAVKEGTGFRLVPPERWKPLAPP